MFLPCILIFFKYKFAGGNLIEEILPAEILPRKLVVEFYFL